jgi:hypothetical protein
LWVLNACGLLSRLAHEMSGWCGRIWGYLNVTVAANKESRNFFSLKFPGVAMAAGSKRSFPTPVSLRQQPDLSLA